MVDTPMPMVAPDRVGALWGEPCPKLEAAS